MSERRRESDDLSPRGPPKASSSTRDAPPESALVSVAASVWIALTSAGARLVAPLANGMTVCRFNPAAGEGVVLAGGVALAVRVGGGTARTVRAGGAGVAAGVSPPNEKGTVVAPVFVAGGAAVVADDTRGARAGLAGGAATVFAPTRRAALSSGRDAILLLIGAGAAVLMRVRGGVVTGAAAGGDATGADAVAVTTL